MFGHRKSPLHWLPKQNSAGSGFSANRRTNPFDSDDELENNQTLKTPGPTSSEPSLVTSNMSTNSYDDDVIKGTPSSQKNYTSMDRNKYKNDFRDSCGLESKRGEDLESYDVYKAEETTNSVISCLKLAEEMREDATKTLVTLHRQGEQITTTHMVAADIDHDLSRGEKLLGSLGGMFSKTWKPKKNRAITGPVITRDDSVQRRGSNHLEQRERLRLTSAPRERSRSHTQPTEHTNALHKVEFEKVKQDDALTDLSSILGELKNMAIDMGSEIERQNKALDHVQDDVDELNFRVKGANQRTRRLIGK